MLITVFIVYLVVLVGIVLYASRQSKTNADCVLGGRKIPGLFLALSERATGESAWLLLGLTGHAYAEGWSSVWIAIGCVTGILFLWIFMAEPLRKVTEKTGALTASGSSSGRSRDQKEDRNTLIGYYNYLFRPLSLCPVQRCRQDIQ
jgi:sodium/proline symporter